MPNVHAKHDDPFKGIKTGKWSKYGGGVHGMVQESIKGPWYCQSCGEEQPKELKPFLFELYPADFIRTCNICFNKLVNQRGDSLIVYKRTVITVRKEW